jgi:subtilisin
VTDGEGTTTTRTAPATETEDGGAAPSIDRFSVSEAGRDDPDAEITVVWDASDADGDLESVDIAVADAGGTVAGVTWTVAGTAASDTDAFTVRNGDGRHFDVSIEVTDATGQSSTLRASVTA